MPGHLILLSDFNIHVDDENNKEAEMFSYLLFISNLHQHVKCTTHLHGHTLDLVITRKDDNILENIAVADTLTDHRLILIDLKMFKPKLKHQTQKLRKTKNIDLDAFVNDINNSAMQEISAIEDIKNMIQTYNTTLTQILEQHAPLKEKKITKRSHVPWYNDDIKDAKLEQRKLEIKWRKTKTRNRSAVVYY